MGSIDCQRFKAPDLKKQPGPAQLFLAVYFLKFEYDPSIRRTAIFGRAV
jgi:hypothetical protein